MEESLSLSTKRSARGSSFTDITNGKSITYLPKYNIYTSAIVGGIAPIALELPYSKEGEEERKVYLFMGEMTCETGSTRSP